MISQSLVLAYHGCDAAVAARVIAGDEHLLPSTKEYDWLGGGIYFWEDSEERAWQWAEEGVQNGRIKTPAVVGAAIQLGHCLNLIDPADIEIVRAAYAHYMDMCKQSGRVPQKNGGKGLRARFLDCEVFNTLHKLRKEERKKRFDTVRAFFVEGSEIYPGAGLRAQDHIQIAVRSKACIRGYFRPR
jgi:hypothetical protein